MGEVVIIITADLFGGNTDSAQSDAVDLGYFCRQQAELDVFGDFEFPLLLLGGNQMSGLLGIPKGDAHLSGQTGEELEKLAGKYPFCRSGEGRYDTNRLALDIYWCMGKREDLLAMDDCCGLRFADEIGVIDHADVVGQEGLTDECVCCQVSFRFTEMLRGHAALAAYRQSLSVFIQDADHAEIELELVSEDLEYVIEYRLQVTAACHKTGGIVKDAQLLPTGFTADVD